MVLIGLLFAAAVAIADAPPVPGLCSAPVPADEEAVGCYQTSQLDLKRAPATLYWHIHQYARAIDAEAEAGRHTWAAVAHAHARYWLYVLGGPSELIAGGEERAVIGPLTTPPSQETVTAHFSEAIFPPGMRTRVHSHPGPEAFYVVEGEQCMETPTDRRNVAAGGTYVVPEGPHLQAAPHGRRNLVLILAPKGRPFVTPRSDWRPSDFCAH